MTTRVLLVDDVAAERRLVRLAIERSGHFTVVGEGGDGGEAIDLAGKLFPDLVVMDLSMPGVDGLEALPRVKMASPGSRVVILSGFSGADVADSAMRQGADGYLEKGLHPRELVAHLTAYARRPSDGEDTPGAADAPEDRGVPVRSVTSTVDRRLLLERDTLHARVLDLVVDGILLEDANGTVRAANASARRLLDIDTAQLGTRRVLGPGWRIVDEHGEPLPAERLPGRTAVRTGVPQLGLVLGFERKGTGLRWLLLNTVPLVDDASGDGAPYGVVTSFSDVTALRERDRSLVAVSDEVGEAIRQLTASLGGLQRSAGGPVPDELAAAITAAGVLRRALRAS